MKTYLRALKFGGPYGLVLPLFLLFTLLAIVFQTLSFTSMAPIIKVIVDTRENIPNVEWGDMPAFSFSIDYMKEVASWAKSFLVTGSSRSEALKQICIAIIFAVFFANLFAFFAKYIISFIKARQIRKLRVATFKKVTSMHLGHFSNEKRGDIMSRLTNDMYEIETTVVPSFHGMVKEPLTIIIVFIVLFIMQPKLTIFSLVVLPLSGLFISQITRKLRKKASKGQQFLSRILGIIDETLGGLKIVKAFNAEESVNSRFEEANLKYQRTLWSLEYKKGMASPVSQVLGVCVIATILYYGGTLVLQGEIKYDNFIAFVVLFGMVISPIKSIASHISVIQRSIVAAERVFELLDSDPEIKDAPNAKILDEFKESIYLENIHFAYENEKVINGINLEIKKGETIALVGASGGGKSTLADLIPRFYEVQEGAILIDGENIKNFTMKSVRDKMGIVSQESVLFNDTLYNNIAFGKPGASKEEIEEAARIANAHDFILEQEHGYETEIGDGGMKLSGGQRQRISIARAILKNPPILILDEATSALDTQSEKLVQEALSKLMENRTSVVIAHRLSTIQEASKIVVVQDGTIVEQGSHQELMEQKGAYYNLKDLQS